MMDAVEFRRSQAFLDWLDNLRDRRAAAQIEVRLRRWALGNPGDIKLLGDGLGELRVDTGPGYRIYFARRGGVVVILLCGGDKGSQDRDSRAARRMVSQLGEL